MEEQNLTFILDAQEKVTAQLAKVEQSLDKLNNNVNKTNESSSKLSKATTGLNDIYGNLGKTIAAVGITFSAVNFLKESTSAAEEDSKALILLSARLKSAGLEYGSSKTKIEEYTDKMNNFGIAGSEVNDGLGKLVTKTKDIDNAMKLSSMAADLAASGYGNYSDNVDNLSKILSGRGAMAMKDYGIKMDENATTAEQLDAVQKKITISSEDMANQAIGNSARMNTNWKEMEGNAGKLGMFFQDKFATAFNSTFESLGLKSGDWVKLVTKDIYAGIQVLALAPKLATLGIGSALEEGTNKIQSWFYSIRDETDNFWNKAFGMDSNAKSNFSQLNAATVELDATINQIVGSMDDVDSFFEKLENPLSNGSSLNKNIDFTKMNLEDLSGATENAAKKMSDAFESFSGKVIDEVDKQKDAISDLRKSMMSETEKYNKEIDDIESNKSYTGIENSAAKEVALANARNNYQNKMYGLQGQESDKNKSLISLNSQLGSPDLLGRISKEQGSFLWNIGQSPIQQQYTFNFNGDVNDVEKLKQLIISTLDRQAALQRVK